MQERERERGDREREGERRERGDARGPPPASAQRCPPPTFFPPYPVKTMSEGRRGVLVESLLCSQVGLFSVVHLAIDRRTPATGAPSTRGKKKKGAAVASPGPSAEEQVRSPEM
jgi:hypothetical protein